MGTAREDILNRLKNAIHPVPEQPDFDAPVFQPLDKSLEEAFKENLERVNGSVYFCSSEKELKTKLSKLLQQFSVENVSCCETHLQEKLKTLEIDFTEEYFAKNMEAGITSCEFLIAHTGSVMISAATEGGRAQFAYPTVHIVLAQREQLLDYLDTAITEVKKKYQQQLPSQITLVTGPSRTADIEKTLVMGAHGPKALHVFVY